MKTETTFSIDFVMRKKKSGPLFGYIYARITLDGDIKEISLKEEIRASTWLPGNECVSGRNAEVKKINDYIDDVRFKLKQKYRELQDSGKPLTAQLVKDAYIGNFTKKTGHKLLELVNYHKEINTGVLATGTLKNYSTTGDYITLFLKNKLERDEIFLVELDFEFLTNFEHYIRTHPIKEHDPCKGNGVFKHIERLRKMVRWSKKLKWIKEDPFEEYNGRPSKPKRKKLNIDELMCIEARKFNNPHLAYVRDLFVFSCYTGLAFTDVMSLTEGDFTVTNNGVWFLMTYRNKSEELSPVPILKVAEKLIKKYKNDPRSVSRGAIFPSISNQEVNRCLKIIQEICGILKELTFHVARHTFATTVTLKNKVPMETVKALLGHKKYSTTEIYAEVDEEKIMEDMSEVESRLQLSKDKRKDELQKVA